MTENGSDKSHYSLAFLVCSARYVAHSMMTSITSSICSLVLSTCIEIRTRSMPFGTMGYLTGLAQNLARCICPANSVDSLGGVTKGMIGDWSISDFQLFSFGICMIFAFLIAAHLG
jgi:hypothetical protein